MLIVKGYSMLHGIISIVLTQIAIGEFSQSKLYSNGGSNDVFHE